MCIVMNIYFCTEVTLSKRAVFVRSPTPVSSQCDTGSWILWAPLVQTVCSHIVHTCSQLVHGSTDVVLKKLKNRYFLDIDS